MDEITLLTPYGYSSSSCGYCSPNGSSSKGSTSLKYGMRAKKMTCQFYQDLIDRGWRRSGDYLYHPDMARTCCPQYTIRLDTLDFIPSKKQRQAVNRWNRFLSSGSRSGEEALQTNGHSSGHSGANGEPSNSSKGKWKAREVEYDFLSELRAHEVGIGKESVHRFETELVPAISTPETYALYKRYQMAVHNDQAWECTQKGFSRFLCDSPLIETDIPYTERIPSYLPKRYGSYHLLYRVDGHLVGISVIDILPLCVSSVYFIWDPDWAWASLGKLSALREIALARDIRKAGVESMRYVYMGYWIANCVKMRYKSEYSPSYLLDPGTNIFHPLTNHLDTYLQRHPQGYYPFNDIAEDGHGANGFTMQTQQATDDSGMDVDGEDEEDKEVDLAFPEPPPPGFADPSSFQDNEVDDLVFALQDRLFRLDDVPFIHPDAVKEQIRELAAAVGIEKLFSVQQLQQGVFDTGSKALITF